MVTTHCDRPLDDASSFDDVPQGLLNLQHSDNRCDTTCVTTPGN